MLGSPLKQNQMVSPTKPSTSLLVPPKVVPIGPTKRLASSPVKWSASPLGKRSESPKPGPYKLENVSAPEVREQARKVLEKFLKRSLSQNDASRSPIKRYYNARDGNSDLTAIKEYAQVSPDKSPFERQDSYVAAVQVTEERRASQTSVSSIRAFSMTVTKVEKEKIREHCISIKRGGLGDSLTPSDYGLGKDFTSNSNDQSKLNELQPERETSDDEDNVSKGRRKKSKFAQAKSRIRDSFLRKQRELSSGETRKSKQRAPASPHQSTANHSKPITEDGKTQDGQMRNGHDQPPRGSTDYDIDEDESPPATYHRQTHANSSPDGLNRITNPEKKAKTNSFWDWFRPTKRRTKSKEKVKSRSLDALTNPAYAVSEKFKVNRSLTISHDHSVEKKHSFSRRCSFRGNTISGVDRSSLVLSGLNVAKPRTSEVNAGVRVLPSDVETDGGFSPTDDQKPFNERTDAEREEVYDLVAYRLAEIASNYTHNDTSKPTSPSEAGATASISTLVLIDPKDMSQESLQREIAEILRDKVDKNVVLQAQNDNIANVMVDAARNSGYKKFRQELKRSMNSEPNLQQLALLFEVTKGAVQVAGAGGALALKVKEYSLRYFEDKFASWIIGKGGWDSMLSDEDGAEIEYDSVNF